MSDMKQKRGFLSRAVRGVWRGLELTTRLIANLAFLFVVVLLAVALWSEEPFEIPDTTALVVAPKGNLVEQLRGSASEQLLLDLLGQDVEPEALMQTLLEAIAAGKDDDRVKVLVLDLNYMGGAGLSKLQALKRAVEDFKSTGKKVIATSDFYLQSQYYLASLADEVFLNHQGLVWLTGYGSYAQYYKEALDKLEVDWNVFRVGEYKSAVEPFLRNDMSPEVKNERKVWLTALWEAYTKDVSSNRGLESSALDAYIENFSTRLKEVDGKAAELARVSGLVDRVVYRDEVRDHLIELVGEDDDSGSYRRVNYKPYLQAVREASPRSAAGVGVVVAKGMILNGNQPPGDVGGDSTAKLIQNAREDRSIKAVVLRVDSPGGSSFASELIRRELELTQDAGKVVVASMGSVAASGGYWISMNADEIWASPTTITGSIGIYAMFPTVERTLAKVGIHNDGVGTSSLGGSLRPDRTLTAEAREILQLMTEQGYQEFIGKVAAGRKMTTEEVDQIARGRVWTGQDGQRIGLVDQLGDLEKAIESAAARAELGDEYFVRYLAQEPSLRERMLTTLLSRARSWFGDGPLRTLVGLSYRADFNDVLRRMSPIDLWGDPWGSIAYCFCETEGSAGITGP
jgi:protease-4